MSIKVTDIDNGYQAMRAALFGPATQVLVGITEEAGKEIHKQGEAATILQIAIWNEFGNGLNSPERSYLRAWFDGNRPTVERWLLQMMPAIIAGRLTKAEAMDRLGFKIEGVIKKTMTGEGIAPANAPSTIAKKGSSTATVEDGTLRGRITHVVRK